MNRIQSAITVGLFAAASFPAGAQSPSGCPRNGPSHEARDRTLKEAGYSLTHESMIAAFRDERADIRLLAASVLPERGRRDDLEPAVQAWIAERDPCVKAAMKFALSMLVSDLTYEPSQHPGFQPQVALSQVCVSSIPALVSLTVRQVIEPGSRQPVLQILARNHTPQLLAFVWSGNPAELFSVTVLDPYGQPAKIASGSEWLYKPKGSGLESLIGESHRSSVPLPPQDDVELSRWRIGADFDMSAPGTYYVSLGGKIGYLDTTVCSNTAAVTIVK